MHRAFHAPFFYIFPFPAQYFNSFGIFFLQIELLNLHQNIDVNLTTKILISEKKFEYNPPHLCIN